MLLGRERQNIKVRGNTLTERRKPDRNFCESFYQYKQYRRHHYWYLLHMQSDTERVCCMANHTS